MLHLDPERLAELADGEPTADESAHLAACAACARELLAHERLLALAADERRATAGAPLSDWDALAARLRSEGLVADGGHARGSLVGGRWLRHGVQAAAAVLLLAVGGVIGRATAARGSAGSGGAIVANAALPDTGRVLLTTDDALAVMQRAENDYRLAAAFIAAHDTSGDPGGRVPRYRARLAALDKVLDASLAAVNDAPADPVVNQYLFSAQNARQATLQMLNNSGVKLVSY